MSGWKVTRKNFTAHESRCLLTLLPGEEKAHSCNACTVVGVDVLHGRKTQIVWRCENLAHWGAAFVDYHSARRVCGHISAASKSVTKESAV